MNILKKLLQPAKAWRAGYASDGKRNPFIMASLRWLSFEDGYQQALADKTGFKGGLPLLGSHLAEMVIIVAVGEIALVGLLYGALHLVMGIML